jgi:hypothetical protein
MKNLGFYLVAAMGYVIYGAFMEADRDISGAIVGEGIVDAFEVKVGDCFDDTDSSGEVSSLPGVPCTDNHDNEAFAVIDLTLESYPGSEAMADIAYDSCMQRFEAFVGLDYESSTLDIYTMFPTNLSWNQNDREVVCAVYDMDHSKLSGSVQGLAI